MAKTFFISVFIFLSSCQLLNVESAIPRKVMSNQEIANGLKESLRVAVDKKVTLLGAAGGFYNNSVVKIGLPSELEILERKLVTVGLNNLVEEGIKLINRAAEDAVSEATPIFYNAISSMTINDAFSILKGSDSAATVYLKETSIQELYERFLPQIKLSLDRVGANQAWETIVSKYNVIPFTKKIEPKLDEYVTQEALKGVFVVIAEQESTIRTNISSRNSDLLKRVFALQD